MVNLENENYLCSTLLFETPDKFTFLNTKFYKNRPVANILEGNVNQDIS